MDHGLIAAEQVRGRGRVLRVRFGSIRTRVRVGVRVGA